MAQNDRLSQKGEKESIKKGCTSQQTDGETSREVKDMLEMKERWKEMEGERERGKREEGGERKE